MIKAMTLRDYLREPSLEVHKVRDMWCEKIEKTSGSFNILFLNVPGKSNLNKPEDAIKNYIDSIMDMEKYIIQEENYINDRKSHQDQKGFDSNDLYLRNILCKNGKAVLEEYGNTEYLSVFKKALQNIEDHFLVGQTIGTYLADYTEDMDLVDCTEDMDLVDTEDTDSVDETGDIMALVGNIKDMLSLAGVVEPQNSENPSDL